MLQQFTWQQFLVAAVILAIVWYLAVFLLYYRKNAGTLFSKKRPHEPVRREWEDELEDEPGDDNLIGRTREAEGVSSIGMEEIRFAPRTEDPDSPREVQLGDVPDVLEELKGIFHILETEGGTKEDFISLFALVAAKHPKIKGTPGQRAINDHIRNHLLFPISDEELDQLWE